MTWIGELTPTQLAAWGAATGTVSLLISGVIAFFSIRKSVRESPRLRIDRASAGGCMQGDHRWDCITAFIVNEGGSTVSIMDYRANIYDSRLAWFLRRPSRCAEGNGWDLRWHEGRVARALPPEKSPPFALKAGEPMRLDLYDKSIWPDKNWRRVQVVVRYTPPSAFARFVVVPNEYNYSDQASVEAMRQRMAGRDNRQKAA
jgi:hypothetical protein